MRRNRYKQNGDDGLVVELHQVLGFKAQEPPFPSMS